jgi:hypothetical protein
MRQLPRTCVLSAIALAALGCDKGSPSGAVLADGVGASDASASVTAPAAAHAPPALRARGTVGLAREMASDASVAAAPSSFARMAAAFSEPAFDPGAMLVRRATAGIEVDSLERAVAHARSVAARHGGIVANAQVASGRHEVHRAVIQLRVPSDRFDGLLGELRAMGRVEAVNVSTQDVGEEYVDMEARLVNLRRLEARIVELLANRTGKLADVLNVENELARIRGEIEQVEGRRRYLQRAASMSTLELTLHERDPIIANTPVRSPIAHAVHRAWRNCVDVVALCISALGILVPVGVLVTALVLAARWFKRRLDDDAVGARA